jgi:thymidylate synthase (FAD)
MKVVLNNVTPNAEEYLVEVARVSSSRKEKRSNPEGLIGYLIRNKHWSPFEHLFMTVEIETSKAIGIQLLRHRSFTFQEFSQRYQNVNQLGEMFEPVEIRQQATDNRQSSTDVFDPVIQDPIYAKDKTCTASELVRRSQDIAQRTYDQLLDAGVAREVARFVLPLATKTKIHMTGSIRSWIHFFELRDDGHAQKEIQEVAKAIKKIFKKQFPIISKALGY